MYRKRRIFFSLLSKSLLSSTLAALAGIPLTGCTKADRALVNVDDGQSLLSAEISKEEGEKTSRLLAEYQERPTLYAQYFNQSMIHEIELNDLFFNSNIVQNSPPGPFLTETGTSFEDDSWQWKLVSAPDYFVWVNQQDFRGNFFIANSKGLPIKSQTISLKNDIGSTLVLLPKNRLQPGTKYFLYLTLEHGDDKKIWIQPMTIL